MAGTATRVKERETDPSAGESLEEQDAREAENEERVREGGAARVGMGKGKITITITADHSEKNDKDLRDAARAFANSLFKMGYTGATLTMDVTPAPVEDRQARLDAKREAKQADLDRREEERTAASEEKAATAAEKRGQSTPVEPPAPTGPVEIPLKGTAVIGLPDKRPQHATTKEAQSADEFGSTTVPGSDAPAPNAAELGVREPGGSEPGSTEGGTNGETNGEPEVPSDAELKKEDDPNLALKPDEQTVAEIKKSLADNEYTVAELEAAIKTEKAGKDREQVVTALERARDERKEALEG